MYWMLVFFDVLWGSVMEIWDALSSIPMLSYVNVIFCNCFWGSICLSGEFCGVSCWCYFGVDCPKEGYAVFILVLFGFYVNFVVLVGVIFWCSLK